MCDDSYSCLVDGMVTSGCDVQGWPPTAQSCYSTPTGGKMPSVATCRSKLAHGSAARRAAACAHSQATDCKHARSSCSDSLQATTSAARRWVASATSTSTCCCSVARGAAEGPAAACAPHSCGDFHAAAQRLAAATQRLQCEAQADGRRAASDDSSLSPDVVSSVQPRSPAWRAAATAEVQTFVSQALTLPAGDVCDHAAVAARAADAVAALAACAPGGAAAALHASSEATRAADALLASADAACRDTLWHGAAIAALARSQHALHRGRPAFWDDFAATVTADPDEVLLTADELADVMSAAAGLRVRGTELWGFLTASADSAAYQLAPNALVATLCALTSRAAGRLTAPVPSLVGAAAYRAASGALSPPQVATTTAALAALLTQRRGGALLHLSTTVRDAAAMLLTATLGAANALRGAACDQAIIAWSSLLSCLREAAVTGAPLEELTAAGFCPL